MNRIFAVILSLLIALTLLAGCADQAENDPAVSADNQSTAAPEGPQPETEAPESEPLETDSPETEAEEPDDGGSYSVRLEEYDPSLLPEKWEEDAETLSFINGVWDGMKDDFSDVVDNFVGYVGGNGRFGMDADGVLHPLADEEIFNRDDMVDYYYLQAEPYDTAEKIKELFARVYTKTKADEAYLYLSNTVLEYEGKIYRPFFDYPFTRFETPFAEAKKVSDDVIIARTAIPYIEPEVLELTFKLEDGSWKIDEYSLYMESVKMINHGFF